MATTSFILMVYKWKWMIQQLNFKEELDAGHSKSPRGWETFLFNVWFTLARIETMLGIEGNFDTNIVQ